MAAANLKTFTRDEVKKHNTESSCWIIVDSAVYDVTKFMMLHPGGEGVIMEYAGQDATEAFYSLHRHEVIKKFAPRLLLGYIENEKPQINTDSAIMAQMPYAEPPSWSKLNSISPSPYYKECHLRLRDAVRKFVEEEVIPEAVLHEENGKPPSKELLRKMGELGYHALRIGPGKHLKNLNIALPGGILPSEYDYIAEMIVHEEFARHACRGYGDGLLGGMVIGLPPVLNFGSPALQAKVVPAVLKGEKFICLAISEPTAGSDVANIKTTAKKTPDGKFYIVNGTKKWITNGVFCDYFSTAVRTDKGISMLLIERSEGVETKGIKTSYSSAAGTAYITFENVKVPVENLLGVENKGFQVIMSNFNHE
ncbi:hypothetical protein HK102_006397, partial [Quaeritorhiza haematococci]